jgi:hypothetical protein
MQEPSLNGEGTLYVLYVIPYSPNQWRWRAACRNAVLGGRKQQPSITMSDDTMKLADHKSVYTPKFPT